MRLLDRYLLREFLVPLGFSLAGFLIFWIAFNLFEELRMLQEMRLRGGDIVQLFLLRIPEFLPVALPVGLLLALLYALTNHARHHEITAIRSAGISLARLCLPYFGIGLLGSAILFAVNEYAAPVTAARAEAVLTRRLNPQHADERHLIRKVAFDNERDGRFWQAAQYNLRSGEMIQPQVDWRTSSGYTRQLFAERAIYTNGLWTFFGVRELRELRGEDVLPARLPQTEMLAFSEFTETPDEIRNKIKVTDSFMVRSRTLRADLSIREILDYLRFDPNPERRMASWLATKLHGRFAGPFTCLVVVVIAVPFAAASGRRNVFVGVAASIAIFFAYYMVQQLGFAFGEAGRVPAWLGAWLPNILFAIAGLALTARVR